MSDSSTSTSRVVNVKGAVSRIGKAPEGVQIFLFGSCCYAERPADMDVLFIYDPRKLPPRRAYAECSPLMHAIEAAGGLPVHPVILTIDENRRTDFSARVTSIPIFGEGV